MIRLMLSSIRLPFFALAVVFAALANGLAFLVLGRMRSLGHRVGVWRTHRDWAIYREYWRVAPERHWSRASIAMGILSLALAASFLWLSLKGVRVPR